MVQVDIYRSGGGDILVIDTGQYLSGVVFDYITQYLNAHVCDDVKAVWFWDDEPESIQSCLAYHGIAIRLIGHVRDWAAAKESVRTVVEEAMEAIES